MSARFDPQALERRYAFVDELPAAVFDAVATLPIGSLDERVAGTRRWRDALLAGHLPAGGWPGATTDAPARRALEGLDLVRFCRDQPDLVDALLADVVGSFRRQVELERSEVLSRLRELEVLERHRIDGGRGRPKRQQPTLDAATLRALRAQAEAEVAARTRVADRLLASGWAERARAWSELAEVFDDLGQMLGRGWDLSVGVLRNTGWIDLVRLRKLLEQLPQIRDIVRALGRLHDGTNDVVVAERVLGPVRRLEEELRNARTPLVPGEARGVERSGELARMLPAEAVMLGHPKLRLVWHARRSERALLTYRVEGTEVVRTLVERESMAEVTHVRPRPERGPIIAVIDTSGSMHGVPEQVAKALVLECLRTAHAERRRCFVCSYSGPGQILEHELSLDPDGIGRLLAFLAMTFGGGNDETGVMKQVVERLRTAGWTKADVVLASDGEWPAPPELIALVTEAQKAGTRFHGVQIGNRGHTGLHAVCDPVHVFTDWAALARW